MSSNEAAKYRNSERLSPRLPDRDDMPCFHPNEQFWDTWMNYKQSADNDMNETDRYLKSLTNPLKILHKIERPVCTTVHKNERKYQTLKSNLISTKIPRPGTPISTNFLPILKQKLTPAQKSKSGYRILPSRVSLPKIESISHTQEEKLSRPIVTKSYETFKSSWTPLRQKYLDSKKSMQNHSNPMNKSESEERFATPSPSGSRSSCDLEKSFSGLNLSRSKSQTRVPLPRIGAGESPYTSVGHGQADTMSQRYLKTQSSRCDSTRRISGSGKCEWRSDGRVTTPRIIASARDAKRRVLNNEFGKIVTDTTMNSPNARENSPKLSVRSSVSTPDLVKVKKSSLSQMTKRRSSGTFSAIISLTDCVEKLVSDDWEANVKGFKAILNMAADNSELLLGDLHRINLAGLKQISNLRSQVCRAACCFFKDMFGLFGHAMEPDIDILSTKLLDRSSDTNKFIRDDAIAALEAMIENLSPNRTLLAITDGTNHRNSIVRTTTAKMVTLIVKKLGPERVLSEMAGRILPMLASFLQEGSLETRMHAKDSLAQLVGQRNFESLLRRHVHIEVLRNIHKSIVSVQEEIAGQR